VSLLSAPAVLKVGGIATLGVILRYKRANKTNKGSTAGQNNTMGAKMLNHSH